MARTSRSKTGSDLLDYLWKLIRCRFFFFETVVALEIELDSSAILFDNFNERLLVNVYPSFIRLRRLVDVHILEHSSDA